MSGWIGVSAGTDDHWQPLRELGKSLGWPESRLGKFMFMGCISKPDKNIFLYKHYDTRRYLNIDATGKCYRYVSGDYVEIDFGSAVAHAFS